MCLHHITYARLGHESDCDLVTICEECHTEIHNKVRARVWKLDIAHLEMRRLVSKRKVVKPPVVKAKKKKKLPKWMRNKRSLYSIIGCIRNRCGNPSDPMFSGIDDMLKSEDREGMRAIVIAALKKYNPQLPDEQAYVREALRYRLDK
jgi:hypothetical protein